MMLKRSEALEQASVTDRELRRLEDQGLVVPSRSWRTLWMVRYYEDSQVNVIEQLATGQRTVDSVRDQERRLVGAEY